MTMTYKDLFIFYFTIQCLIVFSMSQGRLKRFQTILQEIKRPILPLMGPKIQKLRSVEICYDTVGCFEVRRHHNPLQKLPENPELLETRFYLFRRNLNFSEPELMSYNDFELLKSSKFDPNDPIKILVHGYMSKWNEFGAFEGVQAFLDISPCNVILVDWERGARGPKYTSAAANTELVGRQLGLLLLQLLTLGARPNQIHVVGFSLGAHVAACAAEVVKERGITIGRITGLDPASPLFKLNHFRDKRKKLDVSDADFVDVIHTDGSPVFTDGFGLLEPVGHVDYFPNGGREQPGCIDIRNSVVVSHFDKNLDKDIACSHIRAYRYFLETLLEKASIAKGFNSSGCYFMAYSCPGGPRDFALGRCFSVDSGSRGNNMGERSLGRLGEVTSRQGVMFLATRGTPPYCGMQVQIIIHVSEQTLRTKGILSINLQYGDAATNLTVFCDLTDIQNPNRKIYAITAANFDSMSKNLKIITMSILYNRLQISEKKNNVRYSIFTDRIQVKSMMGQSWQHCGKVVLQQNTIASVKLSTNLC